MIKNNKLVIHEKNQKVDRNYLVTQVLGTAVQYFTISNSTSTSSTSVALSDAGTRYSSTVLHHQ